MNSLPASRVPDVGFASDVTSSPWAPGPTPDGDHEAPPLLTDSCDHGTPRPPPRCVTTSCPPGPAHGRAKRRSRRRGSRGQNAFISRSPAHLARPRPKHNSKHVRKNKKGQDGCPHVCDIICAGRGRDFLSVTSCHPTPPHRARAAAITGSRRGGAAASATVSVRGPGPRGGADPASCPAPHGPCPSRGLGGARGPRPHPPPPRPRLPLAPSGPSHRLHGRLPPRRRWRPGARPSAGRRRDPGHGLFLPL